MVLKNCGPKGYPGMAEVGNMALPRKLLRQGVRDMVRISDARMSGTAFGTVLLHVAPEAAVGGTLALVQDGDWIELDVPAAACTSTFPMTSSPGAGRMEPRARAMSTATSRLYVERVLQADKGADLDFLVGCRGHAVPRESH
jgi:L-arabonate dehydrase